MVILLVLLNSCAKDDTNTSEKENPIGGAVITTIEVTKITDKSAVSGGIMIEDGGEYITSRGLCWSSNKTPTIKDNKTKDGTGTDNFSSNISGLEPSTTYHVRAYAVNRKGISYGSVMSFTTFKKGGTADNITDLRDGNVYKTVLIGSQLWMAENLKYLPSVATSTDSYTSSYCRVYGYDGTDVNGAKATAYYNTYGVLYNWYTAMGGSVSSSTIPSGVKGVCPTGWHLPSYAEWITLTTYLGGVSVAGGKLKEAGNFHSDSSYSATNESGFTALPGGFCMPPFVTISRQGYWWSATLDERYENHYPINFWLIVENTSSFLISEKEYGYSVRCLRD